MTVVDPETGEVVDDFSATLRASLMEKNHRLHPAADLLPKMTDEEYQSLKEDIRSKGLRQPIVVDSQGRILDGRHRQRACDELGITPTFQPYRGKDPIGFVLSLNLRRRHLSASQLAAVAAQAEEMYAAQARERMSKAGRSAAPGRPAEKGCATGHTLSGVGSRALAEAAEAVGASTRSAARAKRVMENDPKTFEQVKAGEITVKAAERQVAREAILNGHNPAIGPDKSQAAVAGRRERIAALAGKGYTSDQIAAEVGLAVGTVRATAKESGLTIVADKVVGKRTRIDPNRVVNETVIGLEGYVLGLDLVEVEQLDRQQVEQWATSLSNSLRSLNRLAKQLKEMARA